MAVLASHKQITCMIGGKALTGSQLDVDTELSLQQALGLSTGLQQHTP